MQNICLKSFRSQTAIFHLSQPGTSKNEKIRVFWGLKKEKDVTKDVTKDIFTLVKYLNIKLSRKDNSGNILFSFSGL